MCPWINAVSLANRGIERLGEGDYDEAISLFFQVAERIDELSPESRIVILNKLAFALVSRGMIREPAGAIEDYDAALEMAELLEAPNQVAIYIKRGVALDKLGCYGRAIEDYDRCLDLLESEDSGGVANVLTNRGLAHLKLGRYEQALADQDRALRLEPDLCHAHNNRGLVYNALGEHQRAIANFDRAISLQPDLVVAYRNRAVAYGELGQCRRAIEDFDRAVELAPDDEETRQERRLMLDRLL